ncbi:zf-HC2 domain-containing protein [Pyxidicoccus parkwayensis]|uniref:Zf-HC2 domain-containing protein n=1 Tax=Pyxidicoccus parkwayensis TaxID=2813578 RepID=A0ABX7NM35_9BACT|nr:zf-HC2 domain-containing protein [Pyxidicoccus parkwaysis]QSQ19835.1 zf-HC2 domain-containing protein [Pyxidicoccus parkwaysis]
MSCGFEEDLTAYLDGELPPARRGEVEAHLGTCAGCRATHALLRNAVARLAELPAYEPSPATRRAVLAKLDALPVPWWQRLKVLLRPAVLVPSVGLAAALGVALLMAGPGPEAPDELADPAVMELAANLEVAEDFEVLGLDSAEDLEVVANLHELEVTP